MEAIVPCHLNAYRLLTFALLAVVAPPARAQLRGLPVFFDPTYSYDGRIGVDVGHGGESDGFTIVGGGSHLFYAGNCKRIALSAAAGIWNPPGGDFETGFNGGGTASFLLNSCPRPTSVANPTVRFIAGAGIVRTGDRNVANVPLGVGIGYMFPIGIARIEPWATPRIHYRESLTIPGESEWNVAFSLGANVGVGAIAGLRVAADCCEGGIGGGYGFSLWF